MRAWPDGREKRVELVDLEHENDAVTHDIYHHLHSRPTVPFDRSDALALASGLDDVVDFAEEAADFLGLYRVDAPMDQAIALTDTLAAAGREVAAALGCARRPPEATPHLVEIKRLENEGDRLLRDGLTALFEGGVDPMVVIRWKDIYERVEDGIDAATTSPRCCAASPSSGPSSSRGPASAGNHSSCSSAAIGRNAATRPGSNFVPDRRSISAIAWSNGHGSL